MSLLALAIALSPVAFLAAIFWPHRPRDQRTINSEYEQ